MFKLNYHVCTGLTMLNNATVCTLCAFKNACSGFNIENETICYAMKF